MSAEFFNLKPETPAQRKERAAIGPAEISAARKRAERTTRPGQAVDGEGKTQNASPAILRALLNAAPVSEN